MIEALFTCPIVLQFAVIVAHDLVDIPGWVHGSQVQAMMGKRKVWLATLANAALPGTAAAFAIWFWAHPKPAFVTNYWVIYCLIALLSAVGVWYVPYFLGAQEKQKKNTWRCMPGLIRCCRLVATIRARTRSILESMPCFLPLSAWR
jgi:hypothetical protein